MQNFIIMSNKKKFNFQERSISADLRSQFDVLQLHDESQLFKE